MVFAQSATDMPPAAMVHISGATRQCGKPVRSTWWVRFDGAPPLASITVKTNDSGQYETDLPFGTWTMTLRGGPDDAAEFARPRRFQVNEAGELLFNIYLRPPISCSVLGTAEQKASACWGEEFYEVPTSDGMTFDVDLFGLANQYGTPCSMFEGKARHRESATYNLLSIEADRVAYHSSKRILEASGNVITQDESGEHKADSVRLYLHDGKVSLLPRDQ